jgi:membrane protease YdiL (CAAX protease family)
MKARPLAALGLLILGPLVLGAFAMPWAARWIVPLLHRLFPNDDSFADAEPARVMNRCVMIAVLVLLVPAIRMSGLGPRIRDALRLTKPRTLTLLASIAIGLASMSAAYLLGWFLGGYRIADALPDARGLVLQSALLLAGAIFIGLFEEVFFRGFVFGTLRERCSAGVAIFSASAFFAGLHFFHPTLPPTFDATSWYAGFSLLAHAFDGFDLLRDGAFGLTLFVMGLTLCTRYERDKHLHRCIGLHGGWVLAMQLGALVLDRNTDILGTLLGPGDMAAQSFIALPIIAAFYIRARRPAG